MDLSVNWLRELVPGLQDPPEVLADRLSMTAVPVDGVARVGEGLGGIVVARAVSVDPHPRADRLLFCRVDAGPGGDADVVCGAPVVEEGALYAYVSPGASLPGGMRIESREIRGVMSHGMLCSEHELGLGRDKSGILKLPPDLELGRPLAEALGLPDALLMLDLTPNRVDLACHVGAARELAPGGEAEIVWREFGPRWSPRWQDGEAEAEAAGVRVRIDAAERCSRYLGAVVRGVRVGPSPAWLAGRLRALGLRPVNNVVDATNYILLELNQPLHAFDLSRLRGSEIRVRAAAPGERLRTLDGEERTLDPRATVIADREVPVALAGVMGGEESEVGGETADILLECAAFHPRHARHTARATGLSTEASYRFERGIDEGGLERALARCVELVLAVAGGEAEADALRVGHPAPRRREVRLRRSRVRRLLGIDPDGSRLRELLEPLGFELSEDAGGRPGAPKRAGSEGAGSSAPEEALLVRVPGWRSDVTREVDLIEEVARRHGYENFPQEPRSYRPSGVPDDPAWERAGRVRRLFAARGFLEARSSSFVSAAAPGARAEVWLLNPLSAEEGYLRAGVVPVLLRRLEHNWSRGRRDVRLFEVATAFTLAPGEAPGLERFREEIRAGAVLTGHRAPPHWSGEAPVLDVWDLKGLAAEVAETLCGGRLEPVPAPEWAAAPVGALPGFPLGGDWLGEGGFRILQDGRVVGAAGPVRGEAVDAPPWAAPAWALELRLDAVVLGRHPTYVGVSPYPAVRRDLAVTVPRDVPAARLEATIREAAPATLESLVLFDVYEGEGVEGSRRSLAWTFRFRSPDRTLTDEEVEEAMGRITSSLEQGFDARIRAA